MAHFAPLQTRSFQNFAFYYSILQCHMSSVSKFAKRRCLCFSVKRLRRFPCCDRKTKCRYRKNNVTCFLVGDRREMHFHRNSFGTVRLVPFGSALRHRGSGFQHLKGESRLQQTGGTALNNVLCRKMHMHTESCENLILNSTKSG